MNPMAYKITVIPAKAGIQAFCLTADGINPLIKLDSRLRGNDGGHGCHPDHPLSL